MANGIKVMTIVQQTQQTQLTLYFADTKKEG